MLNLEEHKGGWTSSCFIGGPHTDYKVLTIGSPGLHILKAAYAVGLGSGSKRGNFLPIGDTEQIFPRSARCNEEGPMWAAAENGLS